MRRTTFLLFGLLVVQAVWAGPIGYSVQSNGDGHLYQIDLGTGVATDLGAVGLGDAEGLSFGPGHQLYGIGGSVTELWNLTTPAGFKVGDSVRNGIDAGMDYDYTTGTMYNLQGVSVTSSELYTINLADGTPTSVGTNSVFADNIAIAPDGTAYAIDGVMTDTLYTVNLGNAAMTAVGGLGFDANAQFGTSFDDSGTLWALDNAGGIYTANLGTGALTFQVQATLGGNAIGAFEGLAIDRTVVVPEPGSLAVLLVGGLGGLLRRRRA